MRWLWLLGVIGCAPADPGEPLMRPAAAPFSRVLPAFEQRCATLDCHGQQERNLRLYSRAGLRLAPDALPGEGTTTPEEVAASYRSLVGLEPEIVSEVLQGVAEPEALTVVRKARGTESHAPGAIVRAGDAADRCLVSWLTGALAEEACAAGAVFEAPAPP